MTGVTEMPVFAAVSLADAPPAGYNQPRMALLTLGRLFRIHRTDKGRAWTQGFVAKRAGLHISSVVKVERDDPSVTVETKQKVAAALGTTLDDLRAACGPDAPSVGNSSVRSSSRTRYSRGRPQAVQEVYRGEERESDVNTDPAYLALMAYWNVLSVDGRGELIAAAHDISHRRRTEPKGNVGG